MYIFILAFSLINFLIFYNTVGLSIASRDVCIAKCEDCTTNSSIDLKCGSDGVTYLNKCELDCAVKHCNSTLYALHDGVCSALLGLNNEHEQHWSAESIIVTAQTPKSTEAPPEEIQACDPFDDCTCNLDLLHVCGTDAVTYPNECTLNCATRCNGDLKVSHYGICY